MVLQIFLRERLLYSKKNYLQYYEDLLLVSFFIDKKKGKGVDLGGFHPIIYNNTYLLYKKGWS